MTNNHFKNAQMWTPEGAAAAADGADDKETAVAGSGETNALPVLYLEGQVMFPMSVVPMRISEESEKRLVNAVAMEKKLMAFLALKEDAPDENPGFEHAYHVGCVGRILQLQNEEGGVNVVVQALHRFRATRLLKTDPFPVVEAQTLRDEEVPAEEAAPLMTAVKQQMHTLIDLSPNIPDSAHSLVESIEEASFLSDLVASNLGIGLEDKQALLEQTDPKERLTRLAFLLGKEVEMLKVSDRIQQEVRSSIEENQREYYLRQQLKAIQSELGEDEGAKPEVEEYRQRLEEKDLPEEVAKEAFRELDRLSHMHEASGEYHVLTTYLDWIIDLPWKETTEDNLDIDRAEEILNEDHYGLDKVKRRILEFLAVRQLKPGAGGPILCFLGPPGVGKTSLGQSIARSMNRKFVRMSLGGMRDEAEIRGHRKTYVGAMPGRIAQNIRKAGTSNPVMMLDEIDKVGSDFRGDPSSALLEVLDPAQNNSFEDHYLGVPYDLSKAMFISTANQIDTIPWALRDRMEIIEIPGYTTEEKVQIARKYLLPRQLENNGVPKSKLTITVKSLRKIISGYTREAGVRNLEREIGAICRGVARKLAGGLKERTRVDPEDLPEYLGPEKHFHDAAERTKTPGVATGLAWNPTGGDILFVEATRMPGKGELTLTGQLGDVMKESAQAVLSYVRSQADELGIPHEDFSKHDIHLHVPAGAVPKDGPSAGVAMLSAMASLLLGKPVKDRYAMTGEITLRGLVLPVGGIKEKVLAAKRAGVKHVILPKRNENDLDEVPEEAKKKLTFHFAERMEDVLKLTLNVETNGPAG